MHDVIVVGGGPVGSRVAYRLAQDGHSVLVVERKPRAGTKACCTGIIGRECVETFGIEDKVILKNLDSASLFSPSGERLHLYREEPQACILDRAAFDISMVERSQKAGAEYRYNSRITGATVESDRIKLTVSSREEESVISGRAAVIACGFEPALLNRLGFGEFRDYTIGAQAEVETKGVEEVEVYFGDVAPGFFAWLAPVSPTKAKAGLLARDKVGGCLKKWLAELEKQGKIASSDVKISYGGIPLKPPTRTYGERVIAVGDAAGQVKPLSGGGIYYGLLCADIAAGVLHKALEDNDLSAKRLAGYQRAWRRKLGKELRTGYWTRRLYERMSNLQVDSLFWAIKAAGIDEAMLKAKDLSFDWHSRTVMRLLKYQVVSKTLNIIKTPFGGR